MLNCAWQSFNPSQRKDQEGPTYWSMPRSLVVMPSIRYCQMQTQDSYLAAVCIQSLYHTDNHPIKGQDHDRRQPLRVQVEGEKSGGLFFGDAFFRFFWISGSLILCFSAFPCFFASLRFYFFDLFCLFCFSKVSASLLLAFLLFPASVLLCCSVFIAFLLLKQSL